MTTKVMIGALLATLGAGRATLAAIVHVPSNAATIQAAVDFAQPGDTIRVAPGDYVESIRIEDHKTGLTIESADASQPFTLYGTPYRSMDGIRVDKVDGVTLRGFRIVGAYNGVRLNRVRQAVVVNMHLEDNALGIRVNGGSDNAVVTCTVLGTRVEQGIRVDGSPGIVLADNLTVDTDEQGIRVLDSPGAVLARNVVRDARGNDGIAVSKSAGARVTDCVATGSYHDGFRIARSPGLVLTGNVATGNPSVGIRIERCAPFQSIADVVAAGNVAAGNGQREIVVVGASACTADGCMVTTTTPTSSTRPTTTSTSVTTTSSSSTPSTTSSTSSTSTTATPTTLPSGTAVRWQLYARIATANGELNVNVPKRSSSPPLDVAIAADRLNAFAPGDRVTVEEIAALGNDTLARLIAGADAHLAARPADYPGFIEVVGLRWAMRVP